VINIKSLIPFIVMLAKSRTWKDLTA